MSLQTLQDYVPDSYCKSRALFLFIVYLSLALESLVLHQMQAEAFESPLIFTVQDFLHSLLPPKGIVRDRNLESTSDLTCRHHYSSFLS